MLKRVFCHYDRFRVFQAQQMLEQQGIPCFVKNEFAIGGMGELPPLECMPEVWLNDEQWFARASKLLAPLQEESKETRLSWLCSHCQERNDGHFEICWQCGSDK